MLAGPTLPEKTWQKHGTHMQCYEDDEDDAEVA